MELFSPSWQSFGLVEVRMKLEKEQCREEEQQGNVIKEWKRKQYKVYLYRNGLRDNILE